MTKRLAWAASRVAPELEVHEVDPAGLGREVVHRLCVREIAAERLVAEHGVAGLDRGGHVLAVQERRRLHRDQVDVPARA